MADNDLPDEELVDSEEIELDPSLENLDPDPVLEVDAVDHEEDLDVLPEVDEVDPDVESVDHDAILAELGEVEDDEDL